MRPLGLHFVGQLGERVIHPGEEDVVARDPLEERGQIDVAVDVRLDLTDEFALAAILLRSARQDERASPYEIVLRRERHDPAVLAAVQ